MQGVHVKGMFVAVVAATRKVKEELNAVLCFSKASRNEAYAIAFAWSLFLALVTPTAFGRDMGGRLNRLFGQYQRLRSVNMRAVVQRTLDLPLIEPGAKRTKSFMVVLQYRAAGTRYAISNLSNASGGLGGRSTVAFDGSRFESLAGSYLWFRRAYNGPAPTAILSGKW